MYINQTQGCNSIDFWNQRLEVKDAFRKALDREMVKAWVKAWVKAIQNVYWIAPLLPIPGGSRPSQGVPDLRPRAAVTTPAEGPSGSQPSLNVHHHGEGGRRRMVPDCHWPCSAEPRHHVGVGPRLHDRTGPEYLQYAQKMISSVLLCFSGGTKSGLHAGGQIKSKANCP